MDFFNPPDSAWDHPCGLTVVHPLKGQAFKTFTPEGVNRGRHAKHNLFGALVAEDIDDLYDALLVLEHLNCHLIRGVVKPQFRDGKPHRRLKNGEDATLDVGHRRILTIDIDHLPIPEWVDRNNAKDMACAVLRAACQKWPALEGVDTIVQLSASAGLKDELSGHLYVYTEKAFDDKTLEDFFRDGVGSPFDHCTFRTIQPFFVAKPMFTQGAQDPLDQRIFLYPGARRYVPHDAIEAFEQRACLRDDTQSERSQQRLNRSGAKRTRKLGKARKVRDVVYAPRLEELPGGGDTPQGFTEEVLDLVEVYWRVHEAQGWQPPVVLEPNKYAITCPEGWKHGDKRASLHASDTIIYTPQGRDGGEQRVVCMHNSCESSPHLTDLLISMLPPEELRKCYHYIVPDYPLDPGSGGPLNFPENNSLVPFVRDLPVDPQDETWQKLRRNVLLCGNTPGQRHIGGIILQKVGDPTKQRMIRATCGNTLLCPGCARQSALEQSMEDRRVLYHLRKENPDTYIFSIGLASNGPQAWSKAMDADGLTKRLRGLPWKRVMSEPDIRYPEGCVLVWATYEQMREINEPDTMRVAEDGCGTANLYPRPCAWVDPEQHDTQEVLELLQRFRGVRRVQRNRRLGELVRETEPEKTEEWERVGPGYAPRELLRLAVDLTTENTQGDDAPGGPGVVPIIRAPRSILRAMSKTMRQKNNGDRRVRFVDVDPDGRVTHELEPHQVNNLLDKVDAELWHIPPVAVGASWGLWQRE